MWESAAWAIFFLPLASFVLIGMVIRPFFNNRNALAGYLAIGAIGGAFALSLWALKSTTGHHNESGYVSTE